MEPPDPGKTPSPKGFEGEERPIQNTPTENFHNFVGDLHETFLKTKALQKDGSPTPKICKEDILSSPAPRFSEKSDSPQKIPSSHRFPWHSSTPFSAISDGSPLLHSLNLEISLLEPMSESHVQKGTRNHKIFSKPAKPASAVSPAKKPSPIRSKTYVQNDSLTTEEFSPPPTPLVNHFFPLSTPGSDPLPKNSPQIIPTPSIQLENFPPLVTGIQISNSPPQSAINIPAPPLLPTPPSEPNGNPWKNLFIKAKPPSSTNLRRAFPKEPGLTKSSIDFSMEEVSIGSNKWNHCLVGFFLGRRPFVQHLQENLQRKWNLKGNIQISTLRNGFFLFRFSCGEDCDQILEMGGHTYASRPLILRRWSPGLPLEQPELSTIPIWVKLPGLPLQYWNNEGISKIGSVIGNPLYMDSKTADETRLNFARICVEIEAGDPLPDSIEIHSPFGVSTQSFEYEWKPQSCNLCKIFNHSTEKCPVSAKTNPKPAQEWRPISRKEPPKAPSAPSSDPDLNQDTSTPASSPKPQSPPRNESNLSIVTTQNPFDILNSVDTDEKNSEFISEDEDVSATSGPCAILGNNRSLGLDGPSSSDPLSLPGPLTDPIENTLPPSDSELKDTHPESSDLPSSPHVDHTRSAQNSPLQNSHD
ncbi:uncharacterized protein LOC143865497 [Tasmannia lanceolata]|uniref:uncharacterized protein LOC143865497 n=1 Tax=Tasmannia lanceolata TaxID=3420 RepID=UPI004064C02F